MKLLALLLLFAFIASCARDVPDTPPPAPLEEPDEDPQGIPEIDDPVAQSPLLNITYQGGLAPADQAGTRFIVHENGTASLVSLDASGTITQSKELPQAEMDELQDILDGIGTLRPEHGQEWRGRIADAGEAIIRIGRNGTVAQTRIEPNIPEAYPASLLPLRDWIDEQLQGFSAQPQLDRIRCTGTRPEVCAQVYEPVCGSDGQTHSNGCVACSDPNVDFYTEGACGEERFAGIRCASPRPASCTIEYRPVCADGRTYSNACQACRLVGIAGYAPGECITA